jgi:hypothetical protein
MNGNDGLAWSRRPPVYPVQIRPVARPGKRRGGGRDHVMLMRGARLEHDPESGNRFSEKIMLKQEDGRRA